MANPKFSVKLLTTYINLALAIVNFMTMYQSYVAAMYRRSSAMEISSAACVLWHPDFLEVRLIISQFLWCSRANKVLKLAYILSAVPLSQHSLKASMYLPDAIM